MTGPGHHLIRLKMFTKFRLSVQEKQALSFIGNLELTQSERNNPFFSECFSGVQLGMCSCWILKDFYGMFYLDTKLFFPC